MSAGIPVKITLTTDIDQEGAKDTFELTVFGRYYEKGNYTYLIYDEYQEKGKIHTIVKFNNNEAQITRRGVLNMKLSFQKLAKRGGTFQTDIGTFILATYTERLQSEWSTDENKGSMDIRYRLYMEDMEVGIYSLSFNFKEDLTV